jgi:hypothetical protein
MDLTNSLIIDNIEDIIGQVSTAKEIVCWKYAAME